MAYITSTSHIPWPVMQRNKGKIRMPLSWINAHIRMNLGLILSMVKYVKIVHATNFSCKNHFESMHWSKRDDWNVHSL